MVVIKLETDEGIVTVEREVGETWPEILALFMDVLSGAGYNPGEFYYDGFEVEQDTVNLNFEVENDIID